MNSTYQQRNIESIYTIKNRIALGTRSCLIKHVTFFRKINDGVDAVVEVSRDIASNFPENCQDTLLSMYN